MVVKLQPLTAWRVEKTFAVSQRFYIKRSSAIDGELDEEKIYNMSIFAMICTSILVTNIQVYFI